MAAGAIEDANLTLGSVSAAFHPKIAKGVVTSASYEAGTKLKSGSTVDLTVSKGREPIKITDHTGKGAAGGEGLADKGGLQGQDRQRELRHRGQGHGDQPVTRQRHRGEG